MLSKVAFIAIWPLKEKNYELHFEMISKLAKEYHLRYLSEIFGIYCRFIYFYSLLMHLSGSFFYKSFSIVSICCCTFGFIWSKILFNTYDEQISKVCLFRNLKKHTTMNYQLMVRFMVRNCLKFEGNLQTRLNIICCFKYNYYRDFC